MADNTTLNTGSGGDVIATDDISGVKFQRVKLIHGADGTNDGDVASGNPLPVTVGNVPTVSISGPTTVVVSGTVNTEVVGDVSLTGSMSVVISNVPTVSISGSTTVAVTSVIPGTGATNLGKAVDSAAGATDTGIVPLAVRDDALTTLTPAEGDYVPLRVGSTGALHVEIEGGSVSASGTLSITGSMSVVISSGKVSTTGTTTVVISGTPTVEVGGDVSLTGSFSVVLSGNAVVVGAAAHDAAVSGNPVLLGLEARTANPTAVASGDAVRAMADDLGRQVIVPNAPRDLVTNNHVSLSVSTTVTLLAAGGAGVFRDLLALTISNPASAAATVTIFDDHTTGTQAFKWELAADGGGVVLVFNTPYKAASANTGWGITSTETGVTATAQALDTV